MNRLALATFGAITLASGVVHADTPPAVPMMKYAPPPDLGYGYASPQYAPTLPWLITQLLPSPEIAFGTYKTYGDDASAGRDLHTAFGLRWQVTPLVWSWGVHRKVNRFRWFVVDPIARNSGSIELNTNFEYIWGHVDRLLVRPGVRANFPLLQRGEYLSMAIGTSIYQYDSTTRVAYDAGLYTLFGMFGVTVTVAPTHLPLATIATLRVRYF